MKFLRAVFAICLVVVWPVVASASQPNVILVMSDDQGWAQTSYYGHPLLMTPNLDAMADNGLRMDRFYTTPMCSQTRATILTGALTDQPRTLF